MRQQNIDSRRILQAGHSFSGLLGIRRKRAKAFYANFSPITNLALGFRVAGKTYQLPNIPPLATAKIVLVVGSTIMALVALERWLPEESNLSCPWRSSSLGQELSRCSSKRLYPKRHTAADAVENQQELR